MSVNPDSKKPTWLILGFELGFGAEGSAVTGANAKAGVGYTTILIQPDDEKK